VKARLFSVAQAVDDAAVPLGGAPLPLERERRRDPQLLGEALTEAFSFGVFVEEQCGVTRGTAALRERGHRHPVLEGSDPDAQGVSDAHRLGALGMIPVDLDLPAVDRRGRERARLEETRGPQPAVETDGFVVRRQTADLS
jgi:hypothetical protein